MRNYDEICRYWNKALSAAKESYRRGSSVFALMTDAEGNKIKCIVSEWGDDAVTLIQSDCSTPVPKVNKVIVSEVKLAYELVVNTLDPVYVDVNGKFYCPICLREAGEVKISSLHMPVFHVISDLGNPQGEISVRIIEKTSGKDIRDTVSPVRCITCNTQLALPEQVLNSLTEALINDLKDCTFCFEMDNSRIGFAINH